MGRGRQIDKRETEREEKLPLLKGGRLRLNDLLNNFTSVIHAYRQRNLLTSVCNPQKRFFCNDFTSVIHVCKHKILEPRSVRTPQKRFFCNDFTSVIHFYKQGISFNFCM